MDNDAVFDKARVEAPVDSNDQLSDAVGELSLAIRAAVMFWFR